jgi:tRNA(Ile)-lysidine synthase TilS/MesJ
MTNIAQKNKYDNLRGMSMVSLQDDITFIRPLLNVSKDDIIAFAHSNNIPYLPNSTPVWSQRGQIRNTIVPCLDKWDKRFVPSMFELSDKMAGLYQLLNVSVRQFVDRGAFDDDNTMFVVDKLCTKDIVMIDMFWKEFFIVTFGLNVSSKSIINLIECITKFIDTLKRTQYDETRKIMVAKNMVFSMTSRGSDVIELKVCKI